MLEGVFLNSSNIEWIEKLDCLTDLHVHLDGSLSLESVRHLSDMQNIETGDDVELSAKLSVSSFRFPVIAKKSFDANTAIAKRSYNQHASITAGLAIA